MRSSLRVGIALAAAVLVTGCYKRGENLPLDVARDRVMVPEVEERTPPVPLPTLIEPTEVVKLGDQVWQASAKEYNLPAELVRMVGSAGGHSFYVLAWDDAPYDRLLVPIAGVENRYQEFVGVYD